MSQSDETDADHEFLVSYDYGMGGLWAVLIAPSAEAILEKYPELDIVTEPPKWMSKDDLEGLRQRPERLDEPPSTSYGGFLKVVVNGRKRRGSP